MVCPIVLSHSLAEFRYLPMAQLRHRLLKDHIVFFDVSCQVFTQVYIHGSPLAFDERFVVSPALLKSH